MLLKEFKNFSRQNWWVYCLLIISLIIIFKFPASQSIQDQEITHNIWAIIETFFLVSLNFLWNLFVMVAMWDYQANNNKDWSVYHLMSTLTFASLSLYWAIFLEQYQYLLWQITYLIAAIKAIMYYKFNKDIKIFNSYIVWAINVVLLSCFLYLFPFDIFSTIQVLWFSLVTIGLVSINDTFRFYFSLLWVIFITLWSFLITWDLYLNFNWEWLGISLWYFLLTLSVSIYHLKLLPKYIKK